MTTTQSHVFVSYSHQDKQWLKRLQVHLKPLVRAGTLDLWDDSRIKPGADWRKEIEQALSHAGVAVLLVSADFLASEFVASNELPILLDGARTRGLRILPVIVGHCLITHDKEMSRFQSVNPPDRPLNSMPAHEAEEILLKVAQAIAGIMANP